MKLSRSLLATLLTISLGFVSFISLAVPVNAQDSRIALQRGFRTGYSDGYMSGYRDSIDNLTHEKERHKEFNDANRAFNSDYGSLEDYSDGYRQGFEAGYTTGFEKKTFDSSVPAGLSRKGLKQIAANKPATGDASPISEPKKDTEPAQATAMSAPLPSESAPDASNEIVETPSTVEPPTVSAATVTDAVIRRASYTQSDEPIIIIPRDTEIIIELADDIGTDTNRTGDRFTAKIVSPVEIAGATIEGRIDRIQKPGRIKRRSQVDLSFDRIVISEDRWSNFDAILIEVVAVPGDNIRRIDNEGTAIGKSSVKSDSIKIGSATGIGLGIGAIAGGPVGAAVGAGVGAAFGVGAAVVERGKHIHLSKNQQLRVKAAFETKIR